MKADAIVYTSCTGHTQQYAQMLGKELDLSVYSAEEGIAQLPRGCRVIYLGWLRAGRVKGFRKAARHFHICAVCGVGMFDTGTMTDEVRKATAISPSIPLFTLQGGIDKSRLKGMNKKIIAMLIKGLSDQKQRSPQDERMLELLLTDKNYVSRENIQDVLSRCQSDL